MLKHTKTHIRMFLIQAKSDLHFNLNCFYSPSPCPLHLLFLTTRPSPRLWRGTSPEEWCNHHSILLALFKPTPELSSASRPPTTSSMSMQSEVLTIQHTLQDHAREHTTASSCTRTLHLASLQYVRTVYDCHRIHNVLNSGQYRLVEAGITGSPMS